MRIAVCDDNREVLIFLKSSLHNIFKKYITNFEILCFISGRALLEAHRKNEFDVIFLDIDMPRFTGFDVAKAIRAEFLKCYIVFISSHSELVYNSFDYQPFYFVKKSANGSLNQNLENVVKKLLIHSQQNETFIFDDEFSRSRVVPIRNIIYFESDKHYVNFHVNGEDTPFRLRSTIKECELKFEQYDFIRIHKSYVVDLRYVDFIDKSSDELHLKVIHRSLPISRSLKKEIIEKYTLYLRKLI